MLCPRAFIFSVIALIAFACLVQGDRHAFERRRGSHINAGSRQPLFVNKRAPSFEEVLASSGLRKRSVATAEGAIALPLKARKKAATVGKEATTEPGKQTHTGDGGGGNGDGTSNGTLPTIILTLDLELNVTLDGIDTQLLAGGGEYDIFLRDPSAMLTMSTSRIALHGAKDMLLAPGSNYKYGSFNPPAASDTGIKWKRLKDGGNVHKADLTFNDGAYTLKDIAYGDHSDGPGKYGGHFGFGLPHSQGRPNSFPEGSPPSLTDALADQLNVASASVVFLDDYNLLFGQEPFVDVDPQAFAGSVVPQDDSWIVSGSINGSAFVADLNPGNQEIYGLPDQVQQFFGDQKPTTREGYDGLNFYDVDCDNPTPIEFQLGDKDGGVHTILYEGAALYGDKESSTGCTSILVGTPPEPSKFATNWTLGYAFQYHYTPSYHWDDPSNPVIKFFGRPSSLYPQ